MFRGLDAIVLHQMRIRLREPIAVFFDIFWAPLMLLLFGTIFKAGADSGMPGFRNVDFMIPQLILLPIIVIGFFDFTPVVAQERESGFLRRLQVTPMRPLVYLLGLAVAAVIVTLLSVALTLVLGKILFGLSLHGSIGEVLWAFLLDLLVIYPTAFLLASISSTSSMARALGFIIGFPMMFLSGVAGVPLDLFPEGLLKVANWLPSTVGVKLTTAAWLGQDMAALRWETIYGVLFGLACIILSTRFFRWENQVSK
ncbi:MAG: ABC transporter permease [Bacillota bacterium]|nr:ABC transporter permease [Bacillota bacterium]